MIRKYGYEVEIHNYTTADGYINTLHRIPPSDKSKANGEVAYLQHGLLGTSADFVMGCPEKSLGKLNTGWAKSHPPSDFPLIINCSCV